MTVRQKYVSTLITDPVLKPFAIGQEKYAGYVILEEKVSAKGASRYQPVCYPNSFPAALDYIIRQRMCEQEEYGSIKEYLDRYESIKEEVYKLL